MDLARFTDVLQHICSMANDDIKYDYNSISSWWQAVREILLQSNKSLQSLLAAMMCRTYAARFKRDVSEVNNRLQIQHLILFSLSLRSRTAPLKQERICGSKCPRSPPSGRC